MRSLIVLIAYALSGVGIFFMWLGAIGGLATLGPGLVVALTLWVAAFAAHHRMSMAWIAGKRLGKPTSFVSLTLGLLGFLAVPIAAAIFNREPFFHPSLAFLVLFELLLVSPATILAVYLNWYHAVPTAGPEAAT